MANKAWLGFAVLIHLALLGCASGGGLIPHAIEFDARTESPGVEILAYRFGESRQLSARSDGGRQYVHIYGPMPRPSDIYVKWRIKESGAVFEETASLAHLSAASITDHTIHFIVSGPKLYVYLVSFQPSKENTCPGESGLRALSRSNDPGDRIYRMYCSREITQVYPRTTPNSLSKFVSQK